MQYDLLDDHSVLDGSNTADTACNLGRAIDVGLAADRWTTPFIVCTLISKVFRVGSLKISALTFVVITASSIYSPE